MLDISLLAADAVFLVGLLLIGGKKRENRRQHLLPVDYRKSKTDFSAETWWSFC
jgi:hypothetical protein